MAVEKTYITINGRECVKRYSDSGYFIERDGIQYADAIDPVEYENERTYTETTELIEVEVDEEATEQDYQEALAELGVQING